MSVWAVLFFLAVEGAAPLDGAALCGDPFVRTLVDGSRAWASRDLRAADFGTGKALFDEEWLFATWMMAAVGLAQHARLCPAEAAADLAAMEAAIARMLSREARRFDRRKYGSDIAARLAGNEGSVALLGYGGLALALHRSLVPDSRFIATEQAWAEALDRRFARGRLVETYPGETYPVDNCAGIAALAVHDRTTGEDHSASLRRALAAIERARDPTTGLLHQSTSADGAPHDAPRGSGTFLAAWFLVEADPSLARALYEKGRDALGGALFGFLAMREYVPGHAGTGDMDSGPLVLGYSISATGFALGGAAAFGDEATRARIVAAVRGMSSFAVRLVPGLAAPPDAGASGASGGTGSALGDTILLAMLTATGR